MSHGGWIEDQISVLGADTCVYVHEIDIRKPPQCQGQTVKWVHFQWNKVLLISQTLTLIQIKMLMSSFETIGG